MVVLVGEEETRGAVLLYRGVVDLAVGFESGKGRNMGMAAAVEGRRGQVLADGKRLSRVSVLQRQ